MMTMIKTFNPRVERTIDNKVFHQGIGGKKILIEGEVNINFNGGYTIAERNFLMRRSYMSGERYYYGHIDGLGYVVTGDEIGGPIND